MSTSIRVSTPPPPSSVHTPSTPRFGFEDNYEPYSPHKSTRAQRSRATKTPPPQSPQKLRTSPRSKVSSNSMSSSPSSPPTASKKRAPPNPLHIGGRRVSGALNYDTTVSAAASLGIPAPKEPKNSKTSAISSASTRNNGMLFTPVKTPKKSPKETAPAITAIACNLFPDRGDDVMPSPKKHKARRTYGLDSVEVPEDAPIKIYTDSMDRVPEVDLSPENPFFGSKAHVQPEPTKYISKRRKLTVPGEGEQTVEELEQRDDGLVYVFRGKKIFRKFTDLDDQGSLAEDDSDDEANAHLDELVPQNLRRRLTRSSIKPRLLFPSAEQSRAKATRSHHTDDEEADTDIEEPNSTSTPMDQMEDMVATPKAPRFAPVSPPTTARATRSKKTEMASPPAEPTSNEGARSTSPLLRSQRPCGKVSPFDTWQRVKRPTKKREGEPISRRGGDKKLRA